MSRYGQCACDVKPWKFTKAPAFRCRVTGEAGKLCDECHRMWRAGLVSDWYYGRRSPADPTVVWELNGREVEPDALAAELAEIRGRYGVAAVEWGETWIGYRAVTITYADGSRATERYNAEIAAVEVVKAG